MPVDEINEQVAKKKGQNQGNSFQYSKFKLAKVPGDQLALTDNQDESPLRSKVIVFNISVYFKTKLK